MNIKSIRDLEDHMDFLRNIFDVVRIVDPRTNEILHTDGVDSTLSDSKCYDFWKRGEVCEDCISLRAINENKVTTKIEYKDNKAFFVVATPIIFNEDIYSMELVRSIDDIETIDQIDNEKQKRTDLVICNLERSLMLDELTGAYNRRFINKMLPMEIEDASRKNINLVVIMFDMDNFKEINDEYGHLTGDKALIKVTETINSMIRKNYDWIARYGGDEFIVLLKDVNEDVADRIREQIQEKIEDIGLEVTDTENKKIRLTLSCGIKIIEPGTTSFEEVMESIDQNLQQAKCGGKNKSIVS